MKTKYLITGLLLFGMVLSADTYANANTSSKTSNKTTKTVTSNNPNVLDQSSGTKEDIEVTRRIREELGKSDLSSAAKNVEVITLNNKITLRGTVANLAEKQKVYDTALNAAGARTINNELIIDSTKKY